MVSGCCRNPTKSPAPAGLFCVRRNLLSFELQIHRAGVPAPEVRFHWQNLLPSVHGGATIFVRQESKATRDMSNLFFSLVSGGNILLAK
jgi:hypothetical protein